MREVRIKSYRPWKFRCKECRKPVLRSTVLRISNADIKEEYGVARAYCGDSRPSNDGFSRDFLRREVSF
jgi:hypothetical protein